MHEDDSGMKQLVDRVRAATVSGEITWRHTKWGGESYTADWRGLHLEAEWLKDGSHLTMYDDSGVLEIPRLIMDCLHGVIVNQTEPDRDKRLQRKRAGADRSAADHLHAERRMLRALLTRTEPSEK